MLLMGVHTEEVGAIGRDVAPSDNPSSALDDSARKGTSNEAVDAFGVA
jgi:hypothetical protein